MCTAATSNSRAASAAQTLESIPPLSKTTARDLHSLNMPVTPQSHRGKKRTPAFGPKPETAQELVCLPLPSLCLCDSVVQGSHALHRRIPDELMDLQSHARGNIVGQHPVREFARIEQTVRTVSRATGVFAECRGKQYRIHP